MSTSASTPEATLPPLLPPEQWTQVYLADIDNYSRALVADPARTLAIMNQAALDFQAIKAEFEL